MRTSYLCPCVSVTYADFIPVSLCDNRLTPTFFELSLDRWIRQYSLSLAEARALCISIAFSTHFHQPTTGSFFSMHPHLQARSSYHIASWHVLPSVLPRNGFCSGHAMANPTVMVIQQWSKQSFHRHHPGGVYTPPLGFFFFTNLLGKC
jgi:hypothetical protein